MPFLGNLFVHTKILPSCVVGQGELQLFPNYHAESTISLHQISFIHGSRSIYVCSVYGTTNHNQHDLAVTENIFNQAAERALSFRGPAIICGDLNAPLDKFPAWAKLQQFGWADSALLDQRIHDREPQPTSKGTVRHSFILCCGEMASSFLTCRTACEYEFDAHPLLVTGFSISTLCTPSWKWVLPKALDKFIFNEAEIDAYGDNFCRLNAAKFQDAIHNMDMETAAKIFPWSGINVKTFSN